MVTDETIKKIAEWLLNFDYSVTGSDVSTSRGSYTEYIPDAKDLVEKCGLKDESA